MDELESQTQAKLIGMDAYATALLDDFEESDVEVDDEPAPNVPVPNVPAEELETDSDETDAGDEDEYEPIWNFCPSY